MEDDNNDFDLDLDFDFDLDEDAQCFEWVSVHRQQIAASARWDSSLGCTCGDNDDNKNNDDDLYIMVNCMSVCLCDKKVTKWFWQVGKSKIILAGQVGKLFWQVGKLFWQVGNLFQQVEKLFWQVEKYFGRAGGKIILAGWKIIWAGLVTTRHPVQAREVRKFLNNGM